MNSGTPPSFLAEQCVMPFCKGCGHTHLMRKLDEALVAVGAHPQDVCLVTDIGCIGLADALFPLPHTVHTTHGRSTGFATGIQLADAVLGGSELKTVVLIGDGGATIGLLHIVNAALMNANVTVILGNNYLFGMTGGQNSSFSPLEFITATTPNGNLVPSIDICKTAMASHAGFVARKLATDPDLGEVMREAIAFPGFALVEIVELCTEFGVKRNQLSGAHLKVLIESQGQSLGVLNDDRGRQEFGALYRRNFPKSPETAPEATDSLVAREDGHRLDRPLGIIVSGSAGERVQSSAALFCRAAAQAGLYSTQKNDNPVTQGSGFSLSEVIISPEQILYSGIETPALLVITSPDGVRELKLRNTFETCTSTTTILCDEGLELPPSRGRLIRIPLRKSFGPGGAVTGALLTFLESSGIFPPGDLYESASRRLSRGASPLVETVRSLVPVVKTAADRA